jgi:hypothetical protein
MPQEHTVKSNIPSPFYTPNLQVLSQEATLTNFFLYKPFCCTENKNKMLLQSQCNWQPWMADSLITTIHVKARILHKNANNAYNFVGAKSPSLMDYQKGLNGRKQNVTEVFLGSLGRWMSCSLYHSYHLFIYLFIHSFIHSFIYKQLSNP